MANKTDDLAKFGIAVKAIAERGSSAGQKFILGLFIDQVLRHAPEASKLKAWLKEEEERVKERVDQDYRAAGKAIKDVPEGMQITKEVKSQMFLALKR